MVERHIPECPCLDLDLLAVRLPEDLVPCFEFHFGEDVGFLEHIDGSLGCERVECDRCGGFAIEFALLRLLLPFFGVSVSVEAYLLTGLIRLTGLVEYGCHRILSLLDPLVDVLLEFDELTCDYGVQHLDRCGTVG